MQIVVRKAPSFSEKMLLKAICKFAHPLLCIANVIWLSHSMLETVRQKINSKWTSEACARSKEKLALVQSPRCMTGWTCIPSRMDYTLCFILPKL